MDITITISASSEDACDLTLAHIEGLFGKHIIDSSIPRQVIDAAKGTHWVAIAKLDAPTRAEDDPELSQYEGFTSVHYSDGSGEMFFHERDEPKAATRR